jgi:two-component system, NarL family, response regulator LiaR
MDMKNPAVRVMLVDDHVMVRHGLKILLQEFEGLTVICEADNGEMAIELAELFTPDVILLDLSMPVMDGIETVKRLIARRPDQRILILTGFLDEGRLFQAIQAGALGCVDKTIEPEELLQALHDVSMGKPVLSSSAAWKILHGISGSESDKSGRSKDPLSDREYEVLRLITQGKLDDEIAQELFISDVTIRSHVSRILTKLGLENRVQAALYGLRSGLVPISETSDLFDAQWR